MLSPFLPSMAVAATVGKRFVALQESFTALRYSGVAM
jgi:hypothetical protein